MSFLSRIIKMVFYRDQWKAELASDPMSNFFLDYDGRVKRKFVHRRGPYGGFIQSTSEWDTYRIRSYLEDNQTQIDKLLENK